MMLFSSEKEPMSAPEQKNEDKKSFFYLGLGLFLALFITFLAETAILYFCKDSTLSLTVQYYIAEAAMCFLAFPVGALFLRKAGAPTAVLGTRKGPAVFLVLFAVAVDVGICGEIVSGFFLETAADSVAETHTSVPEMLLMFLFSVILEPICENLFFRKCLTSRLAQWGWKPAILLGGLFYALFQSSYSSFLMAFGLGVLLSFAYLTTGNCRISIGIQACINLLFRAVPVLTERYLCSEEKLTELETLLAEWQQTGPAAGEALASFLETNGGALAAFMIYSLLSILQLGLSLAGAILLFIYYRKAGLQPGEKKLERRSIGDTVFMNVGTVLFVLLSVILATITLLI